MKWFAAIMLAGALCLALGCKKEGDTAGTTGETPTTTGTPPATGGTTASTPTANTVESVAGEYDTIMDDATKAELEKAKQTFGGGFMKFSADGTFEAHAKIGENDIVTKGKFTVEGDKVTTTVDEANGQKVDKAPPQIYMIMAGGSELKAEGTGVTLKKK